jgi:hypothetical protein
VWTFVYKNYLNQFDASEGQLMSIIIAVVFPSLVAVFSARLRAVAVV